MNGREDFEELTSYLNSKFVRKDLDYEEVEEPIFTYNKEDKYTKLWDNIYFQLFTSSSRDALVNYIKDNFSHIIIFDNYHRDDVPLGFKASNITIEELITILEENGYKPKPKIYKNKRNVNIPSNKAISFIGPGADHDLILKINN